MVRSDLSTVGREETEDGLAPRGGCLKLNWVEVFEITISHALASATCLRMR
jgi:hypothetical protein